MTVATKYCLFVSARLATEILIATSEPLGVRLRPVRSETIPSGDHLDRIVKQAATRDAVGGGFQQ